MALTSTVWAIWEVLQLPATRSHWQSQVQFFRFLALQARFKLRLPPAMDKLLSKLALSQVMLFKAITVKAR